MAVHAGASCAFLLGSHMASSTWLTSAQACFLECAVDLACAWTLAIQHTLVNAIMWRGGYGATIGVDPCMVKTMQMCPLSTEL